MRQGNWSWVLGVKEGFEETRDGVSMLVSGKGRGSLTKHKAMGEHVSPGRRKRCGWGRPAKRADSVPSMEVNLNVIPARLWYPVFWSNAI